MRNSAEFAQAFRGVRGGSSRLLVAIGSGEKAADLQPAKVGFVIPKNVGNSVVRHRLYRQLRHIVRARLDSFSSGELIVVRVFPQAKGMSSSDLAEDFEACVRKVRVRVERRAT